MNDKLYPLSYTITCGSFTKEHLVENGLGGCDNIIVHSIMLPPDGSYSHMLFSHNGKGAEMDSNDVWKAWVAMAHTLSSKEDLMPGKRELCTNVFEIVAEKIRGAKKK